MTFGRGPAASCGKLRRSECEPDEGHKELLHAERVLQVRHILRAVVESKCADLWSAAFEDLFDFPRRQRGGEQRELVHAAVEIAHGELRVAPIGLRASVADGGRADGEFIAEIFFRDRFLAAHFSIQEMPHLSRIHVIGRHDHHRHDLLQ